MKPKKKKPLILLTNDDGINAKGLYALSKGIAAISDIVIVAPYYEMSAAGHSITISDPLRIKEIEINGKFFGYAVNGTPADCVKTAIHAILERKPDMVISGINRGANVATNVIYSGTVSAATEGTILGIPSIAVSLGGYDDMYYSFAADFARKMALLVFKNGLPSDVSLNINVPAVASREIKGVVVTRQGRSKIEERFYKCADPRGGTYYWQAGMMNILEEDINADAGVLAENKISVTPIHHDLTRYDLIEEINKWDIKI